jgi:hypothetical protein
VNQTKASLLDRFIPQPDVGKRHEITVHAPVAFVYRVAQNFDIESVPGVHALFWLRGKLLGAHAEAQPRSGFITYMRSIGWSCLAEEPNRYYVAGAACQPWNADVVFHPVGPEEFADYADPDEVLIAWTLECEPMETEITRLVTETRVEATDTQAREKFQSYWRRFGLGIALIRRLLLPAIKREAEKQWKACKELEAN